MLDIPMQMRLSQLLRIPFKVPVFTRQGSVAWHPHKETETYFTLLVWIWVQRMRCDQASRSGPRLLTWKTTEWREYFNTAIAEFVEIYEVVGKLDLERC